MHKKIQAQKKLQAIPGVGKSLSKDLADLGYQAVEELKNEKPETMYLNLCRLRACHIDRCVLYVFRCAVYYAGQAKHDPELLKWWNWKDKP
ncbi:MAG: pathogenicity locus [Deltaproteobacteria bacterium]|nr:MAG: pathogenicity locus [Deltaproteobacteria bacterium]